MQTPNQEHITHEFFPTPEEPIQALLNNYSFDQKSTFIEFNAGNGSISRQLKLFYPNCKIIQVEIREDEREALSQFGEVHINDFLKWDIPKLDNMVFISNPAFSITTQLLDHIFNQNENSHVIILQRLGFLASIKRKSFFEKHPIRSIFPLSKRYSFLQSGKRDIWDYGWFVFNGHHEGVIKPI